MAGWNITLQYGKGTTQKEDNVSFLVILVVKSSTYEKKHHKLQLYFWTIYFLIKKAVIYSHYTCHSIMEVQFNLFRNYVRVIFLVFMLSQLETILPLRDLP